MVIVLYPDAEFVGLSAVQQAVDLAVPRPRNGDSR